MTDRRAARPRPARRPAPARRSGTAGGKTARKSPGTGKGKAASAGKGKAASASRSKAATTARSRPAPRRRPTGANSARSRQGRDSRLRRAARGDRPYAVALFAVLVIVGAMALGPLQNYTAAADRVEGLQQTRDQLLDQVDELEERRARLHDPEEIENRARTQLGLVRPGEIPFVVVTPEEAEPQVGPERAGGEAGADAPWYRRLGRWLAERAGAGG